jgi:hypothetical protein
LQGKSCMEAARSIVKRRPHPESLLRIPLVRQLLNDPQIALAPRAIDEQWERKKLALSKVIGFNPAHGKVYYAKRSSLAKWLADPYASARRYNENDSLMKNVLFAVHDYLHAWAYLAIRELASELGFGERPITHENIEAFVFCHLATEAAAVVGLDYWYLSTIDLNDVCPIGTTVDGLTVHYHERDLPEFRRFHPRFSVQREGMFYEIASFYMDGTFLGFGPRDVRSSPLLLRWLGQEVLYSQPQRQYARRWFAYLSQHNIEYSADQLVAAVVMDAPWQRRLLRDLGALLWEKVKGDKLHRFSSWLDPKAAWRSPKGKRLDFRFINANRFRDSDVSAIESGLDAPANFDCFMDQFVSQHVFDHSVEWEKLLPSIRQSRNTRLLRQVFRGVRRVPMRTEAEPLDLFFLG